MPSDPKIVEIVILACLEKEPIDFRKVNEIEVKKVRSAIKRATTGKGTVFRDAVTRKHFLCGCLDSKERLPEEHLIVGYGYRYGNGHRADSPRERQAAARSHSRLPPRRNPPA